MARITRVASHFSIEEVKERMLYDHRPWCRQRWLIIYNALVDPREASDIAKHVGVSVHTIHKLIPAYNRLGIAAVETPGRGGRRREYLTLDEERDFLTPFFLTFRLSQTKGPQPCGRRPHRVKFDNQKPKEVYSFERH